MPSAPPPRAALRFQHASVSPLGRITLSAFDIRQGVAMYGPRIYGQYALVYITEGEATYSDENGWAQNLVPGDLIIVFPTLRHHYDPLPGTEWQTSYLCFQGPVFDLWVAQGILNPRQPILHLSPLATWNQRFESILGAGRKPGFAPPLLEICRLQNFLAQAITGAGRAREHQDDLDWASQACRLIETASESSLDWKQIARQLGGSVASFRKRFTRLTGQPPARYRMSRRIDRACELMQEGRLTDRQIADLLGFCDEFYFSRRFKQITGKAPRTFRQDLSLQTK